MLPINTTATPLGYQPGLDGLRGLFVAAVLCFHGGYAWATGGYLGVSAFFTLSGFLICSLLIEEHATTGRIDLVAFWSRRARRLLPAAWLAIGVALAYGVFLGSPAVKRALQGDVLAALGYVANWRFIFNETSYEALFAEPSPVNHLWSLAIEEQYYVLFPLLAGLLLAVGGGRRMVLGIALGMLAVASTVWMAVLHEPGADTARAYYGTDTRVAEIFVGAAAAVVWRWWSTRPSAVVASRQVIWLVQAAGLVALVGLLWAWVTVPVSYSGLYRGGFALHAGAVVVLLFAVTRPGPLRSVASFEPLRRLGLISYGVYLYHWPIFLWLNGPRTGLDGPPLFALRCAVTLGAALASYFIVEQPIRHRRILRGTTRLVVIPAALAVLLVAVAVVPVPPRSALESAAFGGETLNVPEFDVDLQERADQAPPDPEVPRISVVGDSTAIGPFYGLLNVDSTSGDLMVVPGRMVLGCGLVRAAALRSQGAVYPLSDLCRAWPESWPEVFAKSQPDIVVVMYGPWDASDHQLEGDEAWVGLGDPAYDELARSEIELALDVLTNSADLVVWLTSPPIDQGRNQIVRGPPDPASDPARIERWNQLVGSVIATYPPDRATMVDLGGWFQALPNGPFDPVIRPDGVHIADDQAPIVGRWLAAEILATWTAR